ncbi:MAG: FliA/WhiG family RNA polymerase sigma factor [Elusimicrobiales bacterium]|nr:FliA/WhiG family RNA polymerase sigma factor [Elusimicrobiales bacterium]
MITQREVDKKYNQADEKLKKYIPLVKNIASKLSYNLPPGVDYEDLVSVGMVGLYEAISRFDESRNTKFEAYARYRIRGSILNFLQSMNWIPRSVKEKAKIVEKVTENLTSKNGEIPSDAEITKELGWSIEEYYEHLKNSSPIYFIPIDELNEDFEIVNRLDFYTPEENVERELKIKLVSEALEKLPEKEKIVVSLYFYEDLNLKEIGNILELTESRISQILSSAINKIKAYLRSKI